MMKLSDTMSLAADDHGYVLSCTDGSDSER